MKNLYKRAIRLEYFTVGYNVFEALASMVFGIMASSIALFGFGLDSIVESLSGLILLWRLSAMKNGREEDEEERERKAVKFVAVTFFILAAYVLYESIEKLTGNEAPSESLPGIIIALLSLIIMPVLAIKKYKTGKEIQSKALVADSKETFVCAFLSFALLLGLGSNYLFGFWQADPIVGLIIAGFLIYEGKEVWEESGKTEEDD